MKFSFFIAKRYFQSKLKSTFISMMSRFTMVGVAFEVMALILVLSFFNGIQDFQINFFQSYEPELRIVPENGKFFNFNSNDFKVLNENDQIDFAIGELKDQVLLKYGDNQIVADLIGLDSNFIPSKSFESSLIAGEYALHYEDFPVALIGEGLFLSLGMDLRNQLLPIQIFYPNRKSLQKFNVFSTSNLKESTILPGGIFSVDPVFDSQSLLVDFEFMKNLIGLENQYSSIRIICSDPLSVQKQIQDSLKEKGLKVLTIEEQHQNVLQAIQIERLFVTLMMIGIIIVASFTLFFSLSLLVVEKRKDLKTMVSMGIQSRQIFQIFLIEGLLITFIGTIFGIILAIFLAYIQNSFGILKTGLSGDFLESYPIKLIAQDFILVIFIVFIVGILASIYPAKKAVDYASENLG